MNILIPLAGHSRRFQDAGYTVPKPFIKIDGIPMIQRVCQMFDPTDHFYLVGQEAHLNHPEYKAILEQIRGRVTLIPIAAHEKGPVFSALQAGPLITDKNQGVIVSYCDFTQAWNYRRFKMAVSQSDGGIAVFKGFHPASFGDTYYAYVRTNDQMKMLELREKDAFTKNRHEEFASSGVYYFDQWATYETYAKELLESPPPGLKEYYVSLLFNLMVRDGLDIQIFEIEKFICWGTPQDLEEYLFWSKYFQSDLARPDRRLPGRIS